ncbi:MAG: ABC transporter substrate-binding protein [Acidimicrobiales bacterium]
MLKRCIALVTMLALVAAACGSGSDSEGAGGVDENKETITLIVNPWSASRLNVEVAKNIIESELGNPVEISEVDENDAMFTGMADGTLDAVLEIWPSGITDAENAFFDEGTVEKLGDLGAIGRIGWFVPSYVIDENPDLASWEGYKDPANAALFATAETGDKGRFLGTDPSYSEFDSQIIENLGLPFEVQFSGSEPATVAELDSRVAANEPILMYWWEPTAAVSKYDLVKVELPPYNDACGASQASGDGGVDCDYPEDPIIKAASAKLKDKDADVYAFLKAFSLSNEDQLSMLPAMEIDGEDPAAVAAEWVDANADKWKAWLPS